VKLNKARVDDDVVGGGETHQSRKGKTLYKEDPSNRGHKVGSKRKGGDSEKESTKGTGTQAQGINKSFGEGEFFESGLLVTDLRETDNTGIGRRT